ncbi:MAG: DeoR/GlpR family DNA-binding transcription regulator [Micromonosporaceae bacterium]
MTASSRDRPADRPGTLQSERQRQIRERVRREGFARAATLAEEFGVSLMTVHRDLDALQAEGWLRKVRGGAATTLSAGFHGDLRQRMTTMVDAKRGLAQAALDLITPGQTIMIDESTTCLHLARRLTERSPLTLITYFQPAITMLAGTPGMTLISLGGEHFPAYDAFLGLYTAEGVAKLRADTLFMSTTAISRGRCYHHSQATTQVKRAMMNSASRRVLLVDHTKFSRQGLYTLAELTDFDLVMADAGLPVAEQRRIRDSGAKLSIVPASPGTPGEADL